MKVNYILLLLIVVGSGIFSSCRKSFLDVKPNGELDKFTLASDEGINSLLVGAYSMLDGVSAEIGGWESASSNWLYGSVRGLEANTGSDAEDESDIGQIQTFSETSTHSFLNIKWEEVYEAIARCNSTIVVINQALTQGTISQANADSYFRQAKTLRGWYHFEAWRMWGKVPYVDENTDPDTVSNRMDIRSKIIDDLTEGTSLLDNMGQIGRFNGTVSRVLLAEALMQMNHDYAGALKLLKDARNGTKPDGSPIGLAPTYGEIFDIVNRNDIESVYTVQTSVNDGSGGIDDYGEVLNFPNKPGGSPGGCCIFFSANAGICKFFCGGCKWPSNVGFQL